MGATRRRANSCSEANIASETNEKFGFQTGSDFTLAEFQKYADYFKECYFRMKDSMEDVKRGGIEHQKLEPSVEDIEGEYWRIIEQPTDEVEVRECFLNIFIFFFCICLFMSMLAYRIFFPYNAGILWS